MPRLQRLFEETPAIEAGLGLAFDRAAIERYQVG